MKELADEVVASLAIGDHRNLNGVSSRAMFGLGVLAAGLLSSRRGVAVPDADVLHVVANPVAHGAQLTRATRDALTSLRVVGLADARQSIVAVDVDAPSVAARSMRKVVHRGAIWRGLKLRRHAPRASMRRLSENALYREYLFLAQAIRYLVAADALINVPASTVVLTDFDRHTYSRPWVWAARNRGLRTVTMVHGSPNPNYVPVLADTVLTWGQAQAEWFAEHSADTAAVVVGRPEIEQGARTAGPIKRVVVCHSAEDLSQSEARRLVDAITDLRRRGVDTLVRLHPSVPKERLAGLWVDVARAADSVVATREPFIESLRSGDGVACIISTAAIEALVSGFPVVVVADPEREVPADLEALRVSDPVASLTANDSQGDAQARVVALTGPASSERLRETIAEMIEKLPPPAG